MRFPSVWCCFAAVTHVRAGVRAFQLLQRVYETRVSRAVLGLQRRVNWSCRRAEKNAEHSLTWSAQTRSHYTINRASLVLERFPLPGISNPRARPQPQAV